MILFAVVAHYFSTYCSLLFRFIVEAVREAPIDPRVRHLILRRLLHSPVESTADHDMEQCSQANQGQFHHSQRQGADGSKSQFNSQEQVRREHAEAAQNQMIMAHLIAAAV